jgi:hypothetical protein
MTTPSGTIGLSDVNAELGFSPTAFITMNDAAVRTLAGVPSGAISMQNLQNKTNRIAIPLTISSNTNNYDVYANRGPTYNPGISDITLTISAPAIVSSTSTGTAALIVPSAFNPGDTVTIINNGVILGRGGDGGAGGPGSIEPFTPNYNGKSGGSGGGALQVQRAITMQNANRISGGGGGGGGGGSGIGFGSFGGSGGGGIGSGSPNGTLTAAGPGLAGTQTTDPEGNQRQGGPGGAGGSYGSNGSAGSAGRLNTMPFSQGGPGGAAGYAIVGNPFITYSGPTGTRNGSVS